MQISAQSLKADINVIKTIDMLFDQKTIDRDFGNLMQINDF